MKKIRYVQEPDSLQCGQAVLAMILGEDAVKVAERLGNFRETNLSEMKSALDRGGVGYDAERRQAFSKRDLPRYALLSLETPRCWHWSLYIEGVFYDPEHGVLDDFPECRRKYYWEIFPDIDSGSKR